MIQHMIAEYTNRYVNKTKMLMFRAILCYFREPNFRVVVLTRAKLNTRSIRLRKYYSKKLIIKYCIHIGENCKIGKNLRIEHYNGIVIGNEVKIGDNCTIYQQVTVGQKEGKYPRIGDDVVIFPGAKVVGDIEVGNHVVIGANSVVTQSIPDGSVVAGVPARVIR